MCTCFTDLELVNKITKINSVFAQQDVRTPGIVLRGPQETQRKCDTTTALAVVW